MDVEAALRDFLGISARTTFKRLFLYHCFLYPAVVFNPSRGAAVIVRPNPTCVGSTLRGKEQIKTGPHLSRRANSDKLQ